jgi:hypothetical protein
LPKGIPHGTKASAQLHQKLTPVGNIPLQGDNRTREGRKPAAALSPGYGRGLKHQRSRVHRRLSRCRGFARRRKQYLAQASGALNDLPLISGSKAYRASLGMRANLATQARRNIGNARALYVEPWKPFPRRRRSSGGSETAEEAAVT